MMDENRVIKIVQAHAESQFPKTCSNCGMVFNSLADYLRNTTSIGDPISYDAEMGNWSPMRPIGTVAMANCKCGTTLAVSSKGLDLLMFWKIMLWFRTESWKRGVSMSELMRYIRQEIRKRVLSGND